MITDYKNLVEELIETKRLLAEKEAELKTIKERKERRATAVKCNRKKSPEEKEFIAVLRSSNVKLSSQEYQDAVTFNRIIKKKIAQGEYGEYSFFSLFNNRVSRLKSFSPFVFDCEVCELNIDAVAQHVASRGESTINSIFKDGLINTIGRDNLYLMGKQIFSNAELDLEQYKPKQHLNSVDANNFDVPVVSDTKN